jgi:hypothetical protein
MGIDLQDYDIDIDKWRKFNERLDEGMSIRDTLYVVAYGTYRHLFSVDLLSFTLEKFQNRVKCIDRICPCWSANARAFSSFVPAYPRKSRNLVNLNVFIASSRRL